MTSPSNPEQAGSSEVLFDGRPASDNQKQLHGNSQSGSADKGANEEDDN